MKYDIVLSGVGGQGILTIAAIIAAAAMKEGLKVRQSEVHGMAQRGGAVSASLRISDKTIACDLIADGTAEMIISMEPLESLRYVKQLSPDGVLITSKTPVENITDYPDLNSIYAKINKLPNSELIDADELAKQIKSPRSANMVLIGAASKHLPLKQKSLENAIEEKFARKGEKIVNTNIEAFRLGAK
jgi:indolepyruvate ferredoxin oxidoreductase, beta subunit